MREQPIRRFAFLLMTAVHAVLMPSNSRGESFDSLVRDTEGFGVRSMLGCRLETMTVTIAADGSSRRGRGCRAAILDAEHWKVEVLGDDELIAAAIVHRQGCTFTVAEPGGALARLEDYGYDESTSGRALFSLSSIMQGLTAGSRYYDLSFAEFANREGFSAKPNPEGNSTERGLCFHWSIEGDERIPNANGDVWVRRFGSDLAAIGGWTHFVGETQIKEVTCYFSDDNDAVPHIAKVTEVGRGNAIQEYRVMSLSHGPIAMDEFSPEFYGVILPRRPLPSLWFLLAGLLLAASGLMVHRRITRARF